jgi:cation diffusion facilitator CzcD-associated flavoprotein CzcO
MPYQEVDVAILGAGLGGLCAAIALRRAGIHNLLVLERAAEVGGTWRDNTYPGCACDIPSHLYSLSFAPKHNWTQPFPSQPEIQRYILDVVQQFDLRPSIRFNSNVTGARWNDQARRWLIEVNGEETLSARFFVAAPGPLNKVQIPDIQGQAQFKGAQFHSSQWQHGVDLTGKRVAVIGTGASAIQIVPELAKLAQQVHVFQRTPAWLVPRPNQAYSAAKRWAYAHVPGLQKLNRWRIYALNEWVTRSYLGAQSVRKLVRWMAMAHQHKQVRDPALRSRLQPAYEPGCKRILVSNDFYPAMQQPHVHLVDQAIAHIEADAIVTQDGARHPCDAIVWCTGFKVTEFISPQQRIVGENALELGALWRSQPARTHLGITVAGFPNAFLIVGPNTGLGSNSIIFMIECQVRYIVQAIATVQRHGPQSCLRTRSDSQQSFYDSVQQRNQTTVWTSGCTSYYQSSDGRVDTLWPGHTTRYWWLTRRFNLRVFEPLDDTTQTAP